MWPEPTFETIAQTRVNVVRAPRAGAPRVLILAPWPLTLRSLRAAWPALTAALDVIAIDLPGFGHSDVLAGAVGPVALARFLVDAFDHFGLDRAHLVGTDVGVPVSLAFAAGHATRIRSLVLCDGPGTAAPVLGTDLRRMAGSVFFRWLFGLVPRTFVKTAFRKGYLRRTPPSEDIADYIAACTSTKLAASLQFIAAYGTDLPAIDAQLAQVTAPCLFLWGEHDVFVPVDNARLMHERLPGSEVVILEGTGHFSNDDDPDGWAAAVVRWCVQHDRG